MASKTTQASAAPAPSASGEATSTTKAPSSDESLITRLVLNPIFFVSFILSFILVDSRNFARSHTHRSSSSPKSTSPSRTSSSAGQSQRPAYSRWFSSTSSTNTVSASGQKQDGRSRLGNGEPNYWKSKQRRLARMEIGDALEMRKYVVVGLFLALVCVFVGGFWVGRMGWSIMGPRFWGWWGWESV
ncbi:hypothetical protein MMC25_003622 [Agyrium rufum]|nr:hypothetical protein [Agyrium rufum]